jgi:hypothetical protein
MGGIWILDFWLIQILLKHVYRWFSLKMVAISLRPFNVLTHKELYVKLLPFSFFSLSCLFGYISKRWESFWKVVNMGFRDIVFDWIDIPALGLNRFWREWNIGELVFHMFDLGIIIICTYYLLFGSNFELLILWHIYLFSILPIVCDLIYLKYKLKR